MWLIRTLRIVSERPALASGAQLGDAVAGMLFLEAATSWAVQLLQLAIHLPGLDSPWAALVPADLVIRLFRTRSAPLPRHSWRGTTPTKGTVMNTQQRRPDTRGRTRGLARAAMAVLTLAVALGTGVSTADAATSRQAAGGSASVKTYVQAADASLARAVAQTDAHTYAKAIDSLASARRNTRKANVSAQALIGAPPTDPESDDPPGPPAVLAALKLDYRISTGTVALFDGHTDPALVQALRATVSRAQNRRDAVLDVVLALPEEGDGADYSDGMADTLSIYGREVTAISTALHTFTLSPEGRTGLTNALHRATATQARVQHAYGGGERVVG